MFHSDIINSLPIYKKKIYGARCMWTPIDYYQEVQKKKAHNCAKMVNHRQGQLKLFYIINLVYFKSD